MLWIDLGSGHLLVFPIILIEAVHPAKEILFFLTNHNFHIDNPHIYCIIYYCKQRRFEYSSKCLFSFFLVSLIKIMYNNSVTYKHS